MWFYFFAYYKLTLHKPRNNKAPIIGAKSLIFGGSGDSQIKKTIN